VKREEIVNKKTFKPQTSYNQIVKASSIVGGAQIATYGIGMVRTKAVAVLLGPTGVGLVGLYISVIGLIQTLAQVGLNQSGVREIAAQTNSFSIAETVKALRRACWFSGVLGWLLVVLFAWPLSEWIFGSREHAWPLAILAIVVLLEVVAGGQKAILQGVRRVADLARLQIAAALLTTMVAVGVYWFFREQGIVAVIILTSVVQLLCSWWFSSRIKLENVPQTWRETAAKSRSLVRLGAVLMYGTLLTSVAGLVIRALVVRELGIDAAGMYQAAWALSGMFALFILQAMGTDFYPRLSAVANDNPTVRRLVSEQIEVGIILALPGIIGVIMFAPWLVWLFYSAAFMQAAELLPWFAIGILGQVIGWPVATIQKAKAATRYMLASRSVEALTHIGVAVWLISWLGFVGVGIAFAVFVLAHNLVNMWIAYRLCRFRYCGAVWMHIGIALVSILVAVLFSMQNSLWLSVGGAGVFLVLVAVVSLARVNYLTDGAYVPQQWRKSNLCKRR